MLKNVRPLNESCISFGLKWSLENMHKIYITFMNHKDILATSDFLKESTCLQRRPQVWEFAQPVQRRFRTLACPAPTPLQRLALAFEHSWQPSFWQLQRGDMSWRGRSELVCLFLDFLQKFKTHSKIVAFCGIWLSKNLQAETVERWRGPIQPLSG